MRFNPLNPLWALGFLVLVAHPATAAETPQIEVEELVLSNGMTWLLYESHDSPTVFAGWIAHVGSAALDNEEAYLIQKMMRGLGLVYVEHQARL